MTAINVEVVDCTFCDELIDPTREDGETAFDCACCGNGWHHYDNCAYSCSAYLDQMHDDNRFEAIRDAKAGW